MYQHICQTCGKPFQSHRSQAKFCNGSCYGRDARQYRRRFSDEKELEICQRYLTRLGDGSYLGAVELGRAYGTNFRTIYNVLRRGGVSIRDASTAHKNKPSMKRLHFPPNEPAPLCGCGCGQGVVWLQKKRRWAKYVPGHYTQRGTQNPAWKGDPNTLTPDGFTSTVCLSCGKAFQRPAKARQRFYCSTACMGVTRRSPHYDGNSRWVRWDSVRKRIRKRDKWTCQDCGLVGKGKKRALHVHHLDENPMNNADDNLILLCLRCHHKRHGIVTPSDWPE